MTGISNSAFLNCNTSLLPLSVLTFASLYVADSGETMFSPLLQTLTALSHFILLLRKFEGQAFSLSSLWTAAMLTLLILLIFYLENNGRFYQLFLILIYKIVAIAT